MPIFLTCQCGKKLQALDQYAGKQIRCPICGKILDVPATNAQVGRSAQPVSSQSIQSRIPATPSPPTSAIQPARAIETRAGRRWWPWLAAMGFFVVLGVGLAVYLGPWLPETGTSEKEKPPPKKTFAKEKEEPEKEKPSLPKASLAQKAQEILTANCYRCHGKDGEFEGGLNYVTELATLVARNQVVPGKPEESKLFQRVIAKRRPMPPKDEAPRPREDEIAVLKQWIEAGAPDIGLSVEKRAFVAETDILRLIHDDLQKIEERYRRFARYFTITHLYNAGLSDDQLQTYRHGLSKLVNSLSWERDIVIPTAIDAAKTIFRIDLRDYQWNAQVWKNVVAAYPYSVVHDSPIAKFAYAATGTEQPHLRADWFVFAASRPPVYHDVLQLPTTVAELEAQLRVSVAKNIQEEKVSRAGFNNSGVSQNNRLIERHASGYGAYWKSYDFASNAGRQNLFAHPIGPGDRSDDFQHDGGEIIFNLPNGLQGYFLTDAEGQRIDKGPTSIVSDKNQPDKAVVNGVSCMTCHAEGIIAKTDQVRDHVLSNPNAFNKSTADTILQLYPRKQKFDAFLRDDAERFARAVEKTGAHLSKTEPIAALAMRFTDVLDLSLVAAESCVKVEDLVKGLKRSDELARVLGPVNTPGGTVQRGVFVAAFPSIVREFSLGRFLPPVVQQVIQAEIPTGEKTGSLKGKKRGPSFPTPSPVVVFRYDVEYLRPFDGHKGGVNILAFAPDGRRALSCGRRDSHMRMWDVLSGKEIAEFTGQRPGVLRAVFSRDGDRVLSVNRDGTIRTWDAKKYAEVDRVIVVPNAFNVAFTADLSLDGRLAVVGEGNSLWVTIWDLHRKKEAMRLQASSGFYSEGIATVAISPDGRRALSGGLKTIHVWDLEPRKQLPSFQGHRGEVNKAFFSSDGRRVLSSSYDRSNKDGIGEIIHWEVDTGKELRRFFKRPNVSLLAMTADEKYALLGTEKNALLGTSSKMLVWDLQNDDQPREFATRESYGVCGDFSADGRRILWGEYHGGNVDDPYVFHLWKLTPE